MKKIMKVENEIAEMEDHSLPVRVARLILIPIMNTFPTSFMRYVMSLSDDAANVTENPGSTLALETMYTRYERNLFKGGMLKGIFDHFWHHMFSQPKAIRNRLKIVERILMEEFVERILSGSGDLVALSIGGGSASAFIESLSRLSRKGICTEGIRVKNIDKSERAQELGQEKAANNGHQGQFEWIRGDAREIRGLAGKCSVEIAEMVGLLDYFNDEKALDVLSRVHMALKEKGLFVVANVCMNREQRLVEKTGWPAMYYRTPESLTRLLKKAGFKDDLKIFIEPLGVHMVAAARKRSS